MKKLVELSGKSYEVVSAIFNEVAQEYVLVLKSVETGELTSRLEHEVVYKEELEARAAKALQELKEKAVDYTVKIKRSDPGKKLINFYNKVQELAAEARQAVKKEIKEEEDED